MYDNIFLEIVSFWKELLLSFQSVLTDLNFSVNWLSEPFIWGYALNDILLFLLSSIMFAIMLYYSIKLIMWVFYALSRAFHF